MVANARVILSDYNEHGWGVSSPDLPSMLGGAQTVEELSDDYLFDLAREAGLDKNGSIDQYQQLVFSIDERVYAVRARDDFYFSERWNSVLDIARAIRDYGPLRDDAMLDSMGDAVFLVALPSDSVESAVQSFQEGDAFMLALATDTIHEYLQMAHGTPRQRAHANLGGFGLTKASTVADLFDAVRARSNATGVDASRQLITA